MMNKVALYIISDGIGGAEQVVWQTINGLKDQAAVYLIVNNEIASYYSGLLTAERILNIGDIYLHLNPKYRLIRYLLNNRYFSIKPFLIKSKTNKIIQFLKHNELNVIHAHLDYALLSGLEIKKRFSVKLLYTVHSAFGLVSDSSLKPQIALKNIDFKSIDIIVFVSEYLYRIYKQNNVLFNEYRIIYNGLDSSIFTNYQRAERNSNFFTILFVGGSKYVKGFDLVVETVEKLINVYSQNRFRVVVLGILSPVSELSILVNEKSLGNIFKMVGFVKPPLHLEYFKEADVLFMPSRSEALPIAAIEALFADLPVIANNTGGIPEIIKHGENGFLGINDPLEYAGFINEMITSNEMVLERTRDYNMKIRSQFDSTSMCRKLLEIY